MGSFVVRHVVLLLGYFTCLAYMLRGAFAYLLKRQAPGNTLRSSALCCSTSRVRPLVDQIRIPSELRPCAGKT